MLHRKWASGAAAAIAATAVVCAAPPASAAPSPSGHGSSASATTTVTYVHSKARYRAVVTCKSKGRWAKGYVETYGKPTKKGTFTQILEWGWAIQKTSGNHKNSRVWAYKVVKEATGWRWMGGPGYEQNALEDSKYHKGKMYKKTTIGYGPPFGEHAINFVFELDRGTGGECNAMLRVPHLKKK